MILGPCRLITIHRFTATDFCACSTVPWARLLSACKDSSTQEPVARSLLLLLKRITKQNDGEMFRYGRCGSKNADKLLAELTRLENRNALWDGLKDMLRATTRMRQRLWFSQVFSI